MKTIITLGIIGFLILMLGFSGCNSYNSMVQMDEGVTAQWKQVEVAYQRRMDLIPNLVSTVQGVANFEKSTLTAVIEARSKATSVTIDPSKLDEASLKKFQEAQGAITSSLSRLMVVAEQYPNLKANQNFTDLMTELEGTENRISMERRKFNEAAQDLNTYVRTFPKNIWAGMFGITKRAYFEAAEGSDKAPTVKFDNK